MKSKLLIFTLLLSLILLLSLKAHAAETVECSSVDNFEKSSEEFSKKAILVKDGKYVRITEKELLELKKLEEAQLKHNEVRYDDYGKKFTNDFIAKLDILIFDTAFSDKYKFLEYGRYSDFDYSKKKPVTMTHGGGGEILYGDSIASTTAVSANLTSDELRAINFAIGGSFSSSSKKDFGMTFDVPEDTPSRVWFIPNIEVIYGYIVRMDGITAEEKGREWVKVYKPASINGFTDGIFELCEE